MYPHLFFECMESGQPSTPHDPMRTIGFLGRWGTYACPHCLPSDIVPIRSWTWRTLRLPAIRHRHLPYHTMPSFDMAYHTTPYSSVQFSSVQFYVCLCLCLCQARPVITIVLMPDSTLGQGTFGTWHIRPSVPVPPIILLTDMVARCRLLAAHGARSCLSVRTQPLTATGAPSQTSTIPYHTTSVFSLFTVSRAYCRPEPACVWSCGVHFVIDFERRRQTGAKRGIVPKCR